MCTIQEDINSSSYHFAYLANQANKGNAQRLHRQANCMRQSAKQTGTAIQSQTNTHTHMHTYKKTLIKLPLVVVTRF